MTNHTPVTRNNIPPDVSAVSDLAIVSDNCRAFYACCRLNNRTLPDVDVPFDGDIISPNRVAVGPYMIPDVFIPLGKRFPHIPSGIKKVPEGYLVKVEKTLDSEHDIIYHFIRHHIGSPFTGA
jgi:hypothetical protein